MLENGVIALFEIPYGEVFGVEFTDWKPRLFQEL
jgi:hypothetical protein